jgi:Zn-dependent protease with chaperone function
VATGTRLQTSGGSTLVSAEGPRGEPATRASERLGDAAPTLLELGAWYYDPRNSHPVLVRLIVLQGGQVLVSGPGVDVECAACELRIAGPILGATLDSVLLPSGAKCEMYAKDEVGQLRLLCGRPVPFARIYRWEQSWALSLLAVACVAAILIAGYEWAIPLGAARVARASPALAQRIGRGTLTLLDMTFQPSGLSLKEQQRIRALFEGIARDYPGLPLKLQLRRAHVANAFALSDGTVVLTDELVQLAEHDDMLVGILFHEAGHVAHGHGLRRAIESSTLAVVAMAYYGAADQVTALAGGLPLAYAQSRYSRGEETEADAAALAGLLRHGKDPRRYAELLRALTRELGTERPELAYFSSHPATPERIQRFENAPSAAVPRPPLP